MRVRREGRFAGDDDGSAEVISALTGGLATANRETRSNLGMPQANL